MPALPTWGDLRTQWSALRDHDKPDPAFSKEVFNAGWSQSGTHSHTSNEFKNGELPHQKIMKAKLVFDIANRSPALTAAAAEANSYFNALAQFLVVGGLIVGLLSPEAVRPRCGL